MKKKCCIIAFSVILLCSCRKDIVFVEGSGPGSIVKPASTNLLIGTWKLVASTSKVEDSGQAFEVDLFSLFSTCQTDNTVTYNANFTCTNDEGPTKCDPSSPQSQTGGKWTLSNDKKTLVAEFPLYMGMESITAEILQLDEKIYKIRYITYINGPKATTTTTYTRVR